MELAVHNRKREISRYAARERRHDELNVFTALRDIVPVVEQPKVHHVDRIALLRLAASYIRTRHMAAKMLTSQYATNNDKENKQEFSSTYFFDNTPTPFNEFEIGQLLDDFLFVLDSSGVIIYVSTNVSKSLGVTQPDLVGHELSEFLKEDDIKEFEHLLSNCKDCTPEKAFLRMKCTLGTRGRNLNLRSAIYKTVSFSVLKRQIDSSCNSGSSTSFNSTTSNSPFLATSNPLNLETNGCEIIDKSGGCKKETMECEEAIVKQDEHATEKYTSSPLDYSNPFSTVTIKSKHEKKCRQQQQQNCQTPKMNDDQFYFFLGSTLNQVCKNFETCGSDEFIITKHTMDMKFDYYNERQSYQLGYDSKSIIGQSFYSFVHPEDLHTIRSEFKQIYQKQQIKTAFYRLLTGQGGYIWVVTEASIVKQGARSGQGPRQQIVCMHQVVSSISSNEILSDVQEQFVSAGHFSHLEMLTALAEQRNYKRTDSLKHQECFHDDSSRCNSFEQLVPKPSYYGSSATETHMISRQKCYGQTAGSSNNSLFIDEPMFQLITLSSPEINDLDSEEEVQMPDICPISTTIKDMKGHLDEMTSLAPFVDTGEMVNIDAISTTLNLPLEFGDLKDITMDMFNPVNECRIKCNCVNVENLPSLCHHQMDDDHIQFIQNYLTDDLDCKINEASSLKSITSGSNQSQHISNLHKSSVSTCDPAFDRNRDTVLPEDPATLIFSGIFRNVNQSEDDTNISNGTHENNDCPPLTKLHLSTKAAQCTQNDQCNQISSCNGREHVFAHSEQSLENSEMKSNSSLYLATNGSSSNSSGSLTSGEEYWQLNTPEPYSSLEIKGQLDMLQWLYRQDDIQSSNESDQSNSSWLTSCRFSKNSTLPPIHTGSDFTHQRNNPVKINQMNATYSHTLDTITELEPKSEYDNILSMIYSHDDDDQWRLFHNPECDKPPLQQTFDSDDGLQWRHKDIVPCITDYGHHHNCKQINKSAEMNDFTTFGQKSHGHKVNNDSRGKYLQFHDGSSVLQLPDYSRAYSSSGSNCQQLPSIYKIHHNSQCNAGIGRKRSATFVTSPDGQNFQRVKGANESWTTVGINTGSALSRKNQGSINYQYKKASNHLCSYSEEIVPPKVMKACVKNNLERIG